MAIVSTNQKFFWMLCLFMFWADIKGVQSAEEWTYDNPENWGDEYPTCNGNRQSPIELKRRQSLFFPVAPIIFGNYDKALVGSVNLTNNGHTVEILVPKTTNGESPYLAGGTLRGKYEAVNVHFHWGSANSRGSEHLVDGIRYDVEMHIVHKNIRYSTVEEASMHSDGLAVLGIMLKIDRNPHITYIGLSKVFDKLQDVTNYSSSATIDNPLSLGQLLGDVNTKRFYTYSGSLTTPNCAEAVTWFVFPQALPVSRSQIELFWSVLDANGNALINNFRPLQKRNNRPILYRCTIFNRIGIL